MNIFASNNIYFNYQSLKDLSVSFNLPLIVHLYNNTPFIKSFNNFINNIYIDHNDGSPDIDLQFWEIIIHRFFISILDYAVRKKLLTYKVFNRNIVIYANNNINKVVDLLNNARSDIINIVGDGNRLLNRNTALDTVCSMWKLLANKYNDSKYSDIDFTELSVANKLKKMILSIRDQPKDRVKSSTGNLLYKLRAFVLATIVFLFLLSQMVLISYVAGVSTVVAFVEMDILLVIGSVVAVSILFALLSTSLFVNNIDATIKQQEIDEYVDKVKIGSQPLSGYDHNICNDQCNIDQGIDSKIVDATSVSLVKESAVSI